MSLRSSVVLVGFWVLSLLAVARLSGGQARSWTPLTEPTVLSGADIGFRVEWMNGRTPTGQIVVRVNGQWVEAGIGEPPDRRIVPPPPAAPPLPR